MGWVFGAISDRINIDISLKALGFGKALSIDNLAFICANGEQLPLETNSINKILSFGSLEHFDNIDAGLQEIGRVLTEDGTAIMVVPNFYVSTEQPQEHTAHYWGWKKIFERNGFVVVHLDKDFGPGLFKNTNLRRALLRLSGKIMSFLPFMQYQLIMVLKLKPSC